MRTGLLLLAFDPVSHRFKGEKPMFTRQSLLLLLIVCFVVGCQPDSPGAVEVPMTVEVTRVVEVAAEPPAPEVIEVTRVVEVPAEPAAPEARPINPMAPIEFDTITSSITGRDYALTIVLPISYMFTDASYPVVFVTDGDFYAIPLAMAAGQLAFGQELSEVIVVGVDYGIPDPMAWLELRELDMGPEGRAAFLRFFAEELIPQIESTYRAEATNRTLAGHSTGGDFALYGLLNGTDTFSQFIASSPGRVAGLESALEDLVLDPGDAPARLFLSVGDMDDAAVVAAVEAFDSALLGVNAAGVSHQTMILDGETHLSARPRAFNSGLRWVFAAEGEVAHAGTEG